MNYAYLYWSLIALVVIPAFAIGNSRAAAIVLGVFCAATIAHYFFGVPVVIAYLVLHPVAFVVGCFTTRADMSRVAVALFVPLGLADLFQLRGSLGYDQWWWEVFWIACAQAVILPFGCDRQTVARNLHSIAKLIDPLHFMKAVGYAR